MQAARLERDLAALAAGRRHHRRRARGWARSGFELLYWVPFLRWFAERFHVAPERLLVVSRGGTAAWYRPFAAGYRETFDYLTPEEFRRRHDERVAANGEQKQTQVLAFERELLRELTTDVQTGRCCTRRACTGCSTRSGGATWTSRGCTRTPLRAADGRRGRRVRAAAGAVHGGEVLFQRVLSRHRREPRVRRGARCRRSPSAGPVVSLATGLRLDDHDGDDLAGARRPDAAARTLQPRDNLAVQTAAVAGASAFVGTYGGFSYLAPFLGVRATAYYSNVDGFSQRHLLMARSALGVHRRRRPARRAGRSARCHGVAKPRPAK